MAKGRRGGVVKPKAAFEASEPRFARQGGLETKRVVVHDGKRSEVIERTAVKGADVLDRLRSRGALGKGSTMERAMGERRYQAATAWATDYERAGMGVAVVASYAGAVSAGVEAMPEMRLRAIERFRSGYKAMGDRGGALAWAIVIDNMDLSAWAHRHGFAGPYASERLREAFDDLAEHYGIPIPKGS